MKVSTLIVCVLIGTVLAEIARTPANAAVATAAIFGGKEAAS
jgi:hypothetical protein